MTFSVAVSLVLYGECGLSPLHQIAGVNFFTEARRETGTGLQAIVYAI